MFRFPWYIWNPGETTAVCSSPAADSEYFSQERERQTQQSAGRAAVLVPGLPRSERPQRFLGAGFTITCNRLGQKQLFLGAENCHLIWVLQDIRERGREAEQDAVIAV